MVRRFPIEVIARALIVDNGKILLCKNKKKSSWYFPGGHVELNEKIEDALQRELIEETGHHLRDSTFISFSENFFSDAEGNHHEILFLFKASIENASELSSQESHLDYAWIPFAQFTKTFILPKAMALEVCKILSLS